MNRSYYHRSLTRLKMSRANGSKDLEFLAQKSKQNTRRILLFSLFCTYALLAVLGTTDYDLLLKKPIEIPGLKITLPLLTFYFVTPLVIMVLHFAVLWTYEYYLQELKKTPRQKIEKIPFSIFDLTYLRMSIVLECGINFLIYFFPLTVLTVFFLRFADYQSHFFTTWHLICITLNLLSVLHLMKRYSMYLYIGVSIYYFLILLFFTFFICFLKNPLAFSNKAIFYGLPVSKNVLFSFIPYLEVTHCNLNEKFDLNQAKAYRELEDKKEYQKPFLFYTTKGNLYGRRLIFADLSHTKMVNFDFRKADLRGASLKGSKLHFSLFLDAKLQTADLYRASLHGAILIKANLQKADLSEANLQKANLFEANLQKADLSLANLQKADLSLANLQKADLSLANLQKADLSEANLQEADLSLANLQKADLSLANLQKADLFEANLQKADLIEANLQKADLIEANLQEADLSLANLQKADLSLANLQKADLSLANLQEAILSLANLQEAILYQANLQGAILYQANLQGAVLYQANLQGAVLYQANLQGADLYQANLQGADLSLANLQGADLYQANLQGADLSLASLQGAILYQANLQGAIAEKNLSSQKFINRIAKNTKLHILTKTKLSSLEFEKIENILYESFLFQQKFLSAKKIYYLTSKEIEEFRREFKERISLVKKAIGKTSSEWLEMQKREYISGVLTWEEACKIQKEVTAPEARKRMGLDEVNWEEKCR